MADPVSIHLLPGETVVWTGRPTPKLVVLRPVDTILIPISFAWGWFALDMNIEIWAGSSSSALKFLGLLVLIATFYMAVGRFLIDAVLRKQLIYAVTDRRVLIVRDRDTPTSTSLDLRNLPALQVTERPDGSGTIRFGSDPGWFKGRYVIWSAASDPTPQFVKIPKVREVQKLIRECSAGLPAVNAALGQRLSGLNESPV